MVEGRSSEIYVAAENVSNSDCLREVETVLGKKARCSGNIKRVRRQHRKEFKVKGPSVRGVALEGWRLATRKFSYIIRLYSCTAVRYAMLRSNRRFKPGD